MTEKPLTAFAPDALELLRASKCDVAKHLDWCFTSMVEHHNDLEQKVKTGGYAAKIMSSSASSQAFSAATQVVISSYMALIELKNFQPVFP